MAEMEKVLTEPYTYTVQKPGKEVRKMLIVAFNQWLQVPEDKVVLISDITKMLHNASLLIDDIEDNSKLRRGIPAAYTVFGVPQTINCANYIYFKCMAMVTQLEMPAAVTAFTEQLLDLHRGQGMDIHWRDSVQCPSEEQYRDMVKLKTGGLFKLAVRLMQVYSDFTGEFDELLDHLGLLFQIRDDYANLLSTEYETNKSYCEDLTEGKFSFPIIHAIQKNPSNRTIINILRQHTEDRDLKRHCVRCMHELGSFEYTRQVLLEIEGQARQSIAALGGNPQLEALLDRLGKLYQDPPQVD